MFRRRRTRPSIAPDLVEAFARFRRTLRAVEEAKAVLASAAPGGRSVGIGLAEALAGFDQGLREADRHLPSWRRPEVGPEWVSCREALAEARRRADAVRMGQPPEGYEQLYGVLADIMEPLVAFAPTLERFRELGLRG
jgi:hypothetical protein